jgi:hypothetical protein
MAMKYIVIKYSEDGLEKPIIFDSTFNHSDIAEQVGGIVVSAGSCYDNCLSADFKLYCYGSSMTLRVDIDTELIKRKLNGYGENYKYPEKLKDIDKRDLENDFGSIT